MTETNVDTYTEPAYAAHIGIGWADKCHAIALQVAGNGKIEESWLDSDPGPGHAWARSLGKRFGGQEVTTGVELSKGALIEELRGYGFLDIYPLNPATTCRYRGAFTPSGAKDDMPDARPHLELVRRHRVRLRLMRPRLQVDQDHGRLLEARRAIRRRAIPPGTTAKELAASRKSAGHRLSIVNDSNPKNCEHITKIPLTDHLRCPPR